MPTALDLRAQVAALIRPQPAHECSPPSPRAMFGQLWRCGSCGELHRFVYGRWRLEQAARR